jgi:glutamyl-tRNA reductase
MFIIVGITVKIRRKLFKLSHKKIEKIVDHANDFEKQWEILQKKWNKMAKVMEQRKTYKLKDLTNDEKMDMIDILKQAKQILGGENGK